MMEILTENVQGVAITAPWYDIEEIPTCLHYKWKVKAASGQHTNLEGNNVQFV